MYVLIIILVVIESIDERITRCTKPYGNGSWSQWQNIKRTRSCLWMVVQVHDISITKSIHVLRLLPETNCIALNRVCENEWYLWGSQWCIHYKLYYIVCECYFLMQPLLNVTRAQIVDINDVSIIRCLWYVTKRQMKAKSCANGILCCNRY